MDGLHFSDQIISSDISIYGRISLIKIIKMKMNCTAWKRITDTCNILHLSKLHFILCVISGCNNSNYYYKIINVLVFQVTYSLQNYMPIHSTVIRFHVDRKFYLILILRFYCCIGLCSCLDLLRS